jgi:hypothetical protein
VISFVGMPKQLSKSDFANDYLQQKDASAKIRICLKVLSQADK